MRMSDQLNLKSAIVRFAEDHGLFLWEEFPTEAPTVFWSGDDVAAFLEVARRCASPIMYLGDADGKYGVGLLAGFAAGGILHTFACVTTSSEHTTLRPQSEGSTGEERLGTEAFTVGHRPGLEPYFDYRRGSALSDSLREIVDAIVQDVRYDDHAPMEVMSERAGHLSNEDFESVKYVASRRFSDTVARRLNTEAEKIAPSLAEDPDFDPLANVGEHDRFVASKLEGMDTRVVRRVRTKLSTLSWERGLYVQAARHMDKRAADILEHLPKKVRDELGFATRNSARVQIIRPFADDVSESSLRYLATKVADLEEQRYGYQREVRYATAARVLIDMERSRAGAGRQLGISTTIVDRICRMHPKDVALAPDDPILAAVPPDVRARLLEEGT